MEEGVLPQNSGREVRYNNEPETSFRQRFMSGFVMMLPVEHQL